MSEHTEITVDQIRAINARAMHANEQDEELQALRDEVARLRAIIEQAASAPGKDWLEWQLKLAAALTPQAGKGGGT